MTGKIIRVFFVVLALVLGACGTIATPEWQAEDEAAAVVTEAGHEGEEAHEGETVAELPTEAPTSTPVPPTATPVPPTATPIPPTAEPTVVPPTATTVPATEEVEVETVALVPEEIGDPANGQVLFQTGACFSCHSVDSPVTLVGPSLQGIGERAGSRVPGQDALTYLHQSIVNPNEHVVEGFAAGLMPQTFSTMFNEQQINDLIAYLLTL